MMRDRLATEIPILRRFARGLTRDRSAADDLVQDCLERALAHQHLYDASRSLRTWLFAIMRNLFLNGIRAHRRRAAASEALTQQTAEAGVPAQFSSVLARQVLDAIAQLPTDQREVLLLVAVEGLSYREAAEVAGVPIGTVMSRIARAREQVRQNVEGADRSPIRRVK